MLNGTGASRTDRGDRKFGGSEGRSHVLWTRGAKRVQQRGGVSDSDHDRYFVFAGQNDRDGLFRERQLDFFAVAEIEIAGIVVGGVDAEDFSTGEPVGLAVQFHHLRLAGLQIACGKVLAPDKSSMNLEFSIRNDPGNVAGSEHQQSQDASSDQDYGSADEYSAAAGRSRANRFRNAIEHFRIVAL